MVRTLDWTRRFARGAALAVVLTPLSAWAWIGIVERPYDVGSSLVAFDPRQDVVVAGRTDLSGDQGLLSVAKFSRSGRLRWQSTLPDVLTTDPRSLAVDGAGHLYVAGAVGGDDEDTFGPFTVIKFDGSDGHEAWRWQPSGGEGLAAQVAVDDHDAVFVVGGYGIPDGEGGTIVSGVVARLDGTTGTPHWRLEIPDTFARAIAIMFGGDVVTVDGGVHRRRGDDGSIVWTWSVQGLPQPEWVEVDVHGDVLAFGQDYALKLRGTDGVLQWHVQLPSFDAPLAWIRDGGLDGRGDVVLAGAVEGSGLTDFAVVKLAGADGRELWRYVEPRDGTGRAVAVAIDRRGDAVATGQIEGYPSGPYFEAVRLDGGTGRPEWTMGRSGIGVGDDVAIDRAGHAVVSGFLVLPDPPREPDGNLVVVRLSRTGRGATGSRRDGPSHGRPMR